MSESTDRFTIGKDGLSIFHKPTFTEVDGKKRVTLGFKVCDVVPTIDAELVCKFLNLGHEALNKGKENVPAVDCDD